jgi:hypothetical protein
MNHPLIEETMKYERVLCVVKGVIKSLDKAEIKRIDNTKANMKLFKKVSLFFITTNTLP